jgi:hypothetical protein
LNKIRHISHFWVYSGYYHRLLIRETMRPFKVLFTGDRLDESGDACGGDIDSLRATGWLVGEPEILNSFATGCSLCLLSAGGRGGSGNALAASRANLVC